jgi:hypothetical protein
MAAQQSPTQGNVDEACSETQAGFSKIESTAFSSGRRMIRFGGRALDAAGEPVTGVAGVSFAIYAEQSGGAPLWQETQNVATDAIGRFNALLGASSPTGIPVELFSSSESLWLAVLTHSPGVSEQPRALLVSVPYSLRAADSDMLGGKAASAYMLANSPGTGQGGCAESGITTVPASQLIASHTATPAIAVSGASGGYLPMFTDTAGDLSNSVVAQSGGNVGIGTTSPSAKLEISAWQNGQTAPVTALKIDGPNSPYDVTGAQELVWLFNAAGSARIRAYRGSSWGTSLQFLSNNSSQGSDSPQVRMTLDELGHVGIGTTGPATALDLGGGTNYINQTAAYQMVPAAAKTIQVRGANSSSLNLVSDSNKDGAILGALMFSRSGGQGDAHYNVAGLNAVEAGSGIYAGGQLQFYTKPSGDGFTAPRMVVNSSGNVGIGTTAPDQMLTVNGSIHSTTGGFIFPDGSVLTTATTLPGVQQAGNLTLGAGSGSGGVGNLDLQTAGDVANAMSDRLLIAGTPKAMTGPVPTANLFSMHILAGDAAGGRVKFTIVASDGVNYAMETGEMIYLANPNQIICGVVYTKYATAPPAYTNTALAVPGIGQSGWLNPQCNPTTFGGDQGVQIFDTAPTSFTPTTHKVYYTIENQSQAAITLRRKEP